MAAVSAPSAGKRCIPAIQGQDDRLRARNGPRHAVRQAGASLHGDPRNLCRRARLRESSMSSQLSIRQGAQRDCRLLPRNPEKSRSRAGTFAPRLLPILQGLRADIEQSRKLHLRRVGLLAHSEGAGGRAGATPSPLAFAPRKGARLLDTLGQFRKQLCLSPPNACRINVRSAFNRSLVRLSCALFA